MIVDLSPLFKQLSIQQFQTSARLDYHVPSYSILLNTAKTRQYPVEQQKKRVNKCSSTTYEITPYYIIYVVLYIYIYTLVTIYYMFKVLTHGVFFGYFDHF